MARIGLRQVRIVSLLGLAVLLFACEKGIVHQDLERISEASWILDSVATFEWEVEDSSKVYDIYITLQHNEYYPYRNLFLYLRWSDGIEISTDTIAAFLAEPNGRWTGKGSGALVSHRFPYLQEHRFQRNAPLSISVQHGMRDVNLEGIEQIGVLIKEHLQE